MLRPVIDLTAVTVRSEELVSNGVYDKSITKQFSESGTFVSVIRTPMRTKHEQEALIGDIAHKNSQDL